MTRNIPVIALTFIFMAAFYWLYMDDKRKRFHGVQPLVFKGLATFCTVILACVGAAQSGFMADMLLCAGLIVCVAADILLGIRFTYGMAAFALGHIFYCAAYVVTTPPSPASGIVFLALAGICLALYPMLRRYAKERSPAQYLAYALLLCVMLSLAVPQRPLLLLGACMFALSDAMLAFHMARKRKSTLYNYACLACYYLAQYLIALSIIIR